MSLNMQCVREVKQDIFWVGASDRRLNLFENIFPIPRGVSYNSYLLLDEKTVLLDTVDDAVSRQFMQNINYVLNGRPLDCLIINHMEPDHCSAIEDLVNKYPKMEIVCNAKTVQMLKQFFDLTLDERVHLVKEGDVYNTGAHELRFVMAPMVHWPEVMVTYDAASKTLFSADAFGTFGALNGTIFADEVDFERDWLDDARRYYANIVGKYGVQVQALLKKAENLEIETICPLHGPIWRKEIPYFIEKYKTWSTYMPEEKGVLIAYASMYGHTENAANILAFQLAESGVNKIAMYDVSNTHVSTLMAEAFRYSHIVLAAPTYNGGIYPVMETFLTDMKALNLQKRTFALLDNGSWAPAAAKQMKKHLEELKDVIILDNSVSVKSSVKESQQHEIEAMCKNLIDSLQG